MPLTQKGKKVLAKMKSTYKDEDKAKRVFYSSINTGKIEGAEKKSTKKKSKDGGKKKSFHGYHSIRGAK